MSEALTGQAGGVELLELAGDILTVVSDRLGLLHELAGLGVDLRQRLGHVRAELLQHRHLIGDLRLQLLDLRQALAHLLDRLRHGARIEDDLLSGGGLWRQRP